MTSIKKVPSGSGTIISCSWTDFLECEQATPRLKCLTGGSACSLLRDLGDASIRFEAYRFLVQINNGSLSMFEVLLDLLVVLLLVCNVIK